MQELKDKYIEFLLKTKGVSSDYADITSHNLGKLIRFLKEKRIGDINQVDRICLDEFQQSIIKASYAVTTKQTILMAVSLFFRYLYDYGYIKDNPGLVIEPPKKEDKIPRNIMNLDEIKFLLNLPNQKELLGMRDFCIMHLLYSSAIRPKELFNLKLEDIDLKRYQALIKRPKNKRDRIVHFDRYTAYYLKRYIEKARPWLLKNHISSNLFISAIGTDLTRNAWAAYFSMKYKPAMDEKFKKNVTPYAFRHTSATHWLDSAARQKRDVLPYIQRQLGHESLESTVIYTHVAIEALREMLKRYHPREINLKTLHKIPSPQDIISDSKNKENK